jgi:NAD(P)-dependent dehydrogenase (short-subunit alcohol dehydrogenase family)
LKKTVFITGDTGFLGSALVKAFMDAHYFVVGVSRSSAPLVAAEEGYAHVAADLSVEPEEILAALIHQYGVPTTVINNAAFGVVTPIKDTNDAVLEKTFALNVFAPFKITRALIPLYDREGIVRNIFNNRSIINVSSAGMYPEVVEWDKRPFAAYFAAKAALSTFSLAASKELAEYGVRVNALAPTYFTGNPALVEKISRQCVRLALGRRNGIIV